MVLKRNVDPTNNKTLKNEIETLKRPNRQEILKSLLPITRLSRMRLKQSQREIAVAMKVSTNNKTLKNEIETILISVR